MADGQDPRRWADVEEIKKLKARYFRYLDLKRWEEFGALFTENATMAVSYGEFSGRQKIVETVSARVSGARTVHHGHMPEIELTGPTTAHGIWPMFDIVDRRSADGSGFFKQGYGHYEESYLKQGDTWRIAAMRLTRLRQDQFEMREDAPVKQRTFFPPDQPTDV